MLNNSRQAQKKIKTTGLLNFIEVDSFIKKKKIENEQEERVNDCSSKH